MGSPLSPVAACLYIETLEVSDFVYIIGTNSVWMRYVDDVLVVVPKITNLEQKLMQLNNVNARIQFTIENERYDQLAFLDACIMKLETNFKFKVHRKPTNKEYYVHFESGHSERVKSGIVIGFFPRAMRVCDHEYLDEEIKHTKRS